MLDKLSWKTLLAELLLCCVPALLLGALFGYWPWFLLLALCLLWLWQGWNQLRLSHWLWVDRSMTPSGRGSWEPLFYGLYQMQQRNRRRRRELTLLIKRFRSGAESLPDAIVMLTDEGNIFWCNQLAQHLLSFRWPEDNGQNIRNLLRYPEFSAYLTSADYSQPLTLHLNSGRYMEFRLMPYSEGQLLMIARDVTQTRQLEGARRNFFANVSHELRTPLTVLQGYLEMFGSDEMPAAQREGARHHAGADAAHGWSGAATAGVVAYRGGAAHRPQRAGGCTGAAPSAGARGALPQRRSSHPALYHRRDATGTRQRRAAR